MNTETSHPEIQKKIFIQHQLFRRRHTYCYSFFSGNDGSTSIGAMPVIREIMYPPKIDIVPQVRPTTTPPSTIFLQGYGSRFTAATTAATPIETLQLIIIRFFVAWKSPMEYNGARSRWWIGEEDGRRVKERDTTSGENLSWNPLYPST